MSRRQPAVVTPAAKSPSRLALLAALTAAVIALALGLYAGNALADPMGGARYVLLTPVVGDTTIPHDSVPANRVVRLADGHMALLGPPGYGEVALGPDQTAGIRLFIEHSREWGDDYTIAGVLPEQRWELRLDGDHPRIIVIDNPLANDGLPESLYQLLLATLRPNLADNPTLITPTALRLRLIPLAPGQNLENVAVNPWPAQLDVARAATGSGQVISGADLKALDATSALLSRLGLGQNGALVRLPDGSVRRLFWTIEWSSWTPA